MKNKEKVQKDKQRSTKHAYKTKDRATRTPLKTDRMHVNSLERGFVEHLAHPGCSYRLEFKKLSGSMSTRSTSILKELNVAQHLSLLHDKYVIVSADKAPNNIVFASPFWPTPVPLYMTVYLFHII
jgi:hypothetical protein